MSVDATPPYMPGHSPLLAEVKTEVLMAIRELAPIGLRTPSAGYKPFRYPWAFEMWKKHEQVHWMGEEVDLGGDVLDWRSRLTPAEKNLLTQIFRLFTK